MARPSTAFITAALAAVLATPQEAQVPRQFMVGGGLGHLVRGVANPPLRLNDDVVAIASEGGSNGANIPDDQLVVVSGFVNGSINVETAGLYAALGFTGDLTPTMVRLSATTFLYCDSGAFSGAPALVVVGTTPTTQILTVHSVDKPHALDPGLQSVAVLAPDTILWVAAGPDGLYGTPDDLVVVAHGLGTPQFALSEQGPGVGLTTEATAVSSTIAAVRSVGSDGVPATQDDEIVVARFSTGGVKCLRVPAGWGLTTYASQPGPVLLEADADPVLIYPVAPTPRHAPLYLAVDQWSTVPRVTAIGLIAELPLNWGFIPRPVDLGGRTLAYFNAGANRTFHDTDDQIRVVTLLPDGTVRGDRFYPGVALGFSDTSIGPIALTNDRVAFPMSGVSARGGNLGDGLLLVEDIHSQHPIMTSISLGATLVAWTKVNPTAVCTIDDQSSLQWVLDLGVSVPQISRAVDPAPAGMLPTWLNDWTAITSTMVNTDPNNLRDDLVAIQVPWVEMFGAASACGDGQFPAILRTTPYPGSDFPAQLGNVLAGDPVALVLSWYGGYTQINAVSDLWLDAPNIFGDHVLSTDVFGRATVYLHLDPLPWLTGLSLAGQWGVYDQYAYGGFCVSQGFRIHLE